MQFSTNEKRYQDQIDELRKQTKDQIDALKQDIHHLRELREEAERDKNEAFITTEKALREMAYWKAIVGALVS